jgi:hypothetical protein
LGCCHLVKDAAPAELPRGAFRNERHHFDCFGPRQEKVRPRSGGCFGRYPMYCLFGGWW